ncbi:uncharacterized protein LODBEIA_P26510 [Lodderomyces beijingensis]|uniref:Uncharacterized protein n=1 Tax=Lodderomyces beijingensis TaxID=1775926 RepID=A0ABP0ZJV8_9ASCO
MSDKIKSKNVVFPGSSETDSKSGEPTSDESGSPHTQQVDFVSNESPTQGNTSSNNSSSNNLPSDAYLKKQLPLQQEWQHLKLHIPGEQVQTNTLKERIPKFPLGKENVPTLLPRPGVPQVGPKYTFRQVIKILQLKKQPELIYESEPHRLYFLLCTCAAVVFGIYACVLLEWAFWISNKEYEENEKEETNDAIRNRDYYLSLGMYLCPSLIMFSAAYFFAKFPTRLVRRMWYLPGPIEHVKFTTYPLIPGRPTPTYTVPLANLTRRETTRVWTGKGFYGTADKGFFFFVLRERISKFKTINWVVDRKGFFWCDGRVFDYLFGKETIQEAEAGIPYDQQFALVNKQLKEQKRKLRNEHGLLWRYKMALGEFTSDVGKLGQRLGVTKRIGDKKAESERKQLPKK